MKSRNKYRLFLDTINTIVLTGGTAFLIWWLWQLLPMMITMIDMNKIARIRQEIEGRINILTNVYAEQVERKDEEMMNYYHGKVIALEELRPFLDTLSEEPDKSLEEAARHSEILTYPMPDDGDIEKVMKVQEARIFHEIGFKAGAEWQASQMPMPEDTVLFNKGVAEGRRLEREDMMHDALEGEVIKTDKHTSVRYKSFYGTDRYFYGIADKQFKPGDKVRIVVLKEEE